MIEFQVNSAKWCTRGNGLYEWTFLSFIALFLEKMGFFLQQSSENLKSYHFRKRYLDSYKVSFMSKGCC